METRRTCFEIFFFNQEDKNFTSRCSGLKLPSKQDAKTAPLHKIHDVTNNNPLPKKKKKPGKNKKIRLAFLIFLFSLLHFYASSNGLLSELH